jgi:malate synthase
MSPYLQILNTITDLFSQTAVTEGQRNLRDATRGKITYTNAETGRVYALKQKTAVLFVRPRGWHLDEAHVTVNGRVASGSLFDFALYFYHNVHCLLGKGTRPYFYLPKLVRVVS